MTSAAHTPFRLQAGSGATAAIFLAGGLTISGQVTVYCTSLTGTLAGPISVDFTPASPPVLVLPDLTLSKVAIGLVDVQAQHLTASGFGVATG
jgi:hypothetical protein